MSVALLYLAAHLLGDFPLQRDWIAANKFDVFWVLCIHVAVHMVLAVGAGLLVGLAVPTMIGIAVLIGLSHLFIDHKRWNEPKDGFENYPIWCDQAYHVTALALILTTVL